MEALGSVRGRDSLQIPYIVGHGEKQGSGSAGASGILREDRHSCLGSSVGRAMD